MTTLVSGGTVVTGADSYKADVLIDGEKVVAIGKDLKAGGAKRVDASRKYVIPGGIDVHTHMELPFGGTFASDDFHTGTVAAAFGGTTSIVDFAVQGMGEPLEKARDLWLSKARGKAVIDYGLHMIVRDVSDKVLREMGTMVEDGVSSFKFFMAYPGVFMVDDASIFKALVRSAEVGGLICMHAENGGVIDVLVKKALAEKKTEPKWHALTRPPEAEGEATGRAFKLAEMAGGVPLYVEELTKAMVEPGVARGDRAEVGHMSAGQQDDRQPFLLARRPEPVERAVGPPALLVRLVEGEAEAEHARPLPPVFDDVEPIRVLQVEIPQDTECVRVLARRFDRERVDRLAKRAGRMDHRCIDPGRRHLLQGVVHREGRDLPVLRRHSGIFPEVYLCIDDLHRVPPSGYACTVTRSLHARA
jgi:hypothetical protein